MQKHALRRVIPYVGRQKKLLALTTVLALFALAAETTMPLVTREIFDGPLKGEGSGASLLALVGLYLLLGAAETGLSFFRRNKSARIGHQIETDIRNDLYAHLQRLHVGFHDNWQSGQLLTRATTDINILRRFIGFGAVFMALLGVQVVVIAGLLLTINVPLTILTVAGLTPIGIISYRWSSNYRVISRRVQDEQGDLGTIVEEAANGIRIIKAFGRGETITKKFHDQAAKLRLSFLDQVKMRARLWPAFDTVFNTVLVSIVLLGGLTVMDGGAMSLGDLIAFVQYMMMLVWPIDALGWILSMLEESRTASERLFEVFDSEPEVADRPGAITMPEVKGAVSFEGVGFRHQRSDWILKGLDLQIAPGETVAVIGRTGSGKTTLAMLLPRLLDAVEGRVCIDGVDVRDIALSSLREHVGVAFEDPILFSASVRENLLMGLRSATDEEIEVALRTARAEFVYDLPWGLETRVGEQGYTLSGGQRQRLALARAVLGRPTILVLDDPLSSVDVHTEAQIEESLRSVLQGVTGLLIAHRPSTLMLADRVALLDGGRIVSTGTHAELMETDPLYRSILSQQAEEHEAEAAREAAHGALTGEVR